jgi:hypothetical protein
MTPEQITRVNELYTQLDQAKADARELRQLHHEVTMENDDMRSIIKSMQHKLTQEDRLDTLLHELTDVLHKINKSPAKPKAKTRKAT